MCILALITPVMVLRFIPLRHSATPELSSLLCLLVADVGRKGERLVESFWDDKTRGTILETFVFAIEPVKHAASDVVDELAKIFSLANVADASCILCVCQSRSHSLVVAKAAGALEDDSVLVNG